MDWRFFQDTGFILPVQMSVYIDGVFVKCYNLK